jgi:hypothetical protein
MHFLINSVIKKKIRKILVCTIFFPTFISANPNPIFDANLVPNRDTVILLKDKVHTLIGRIGNNENINSQNRDTLFESIRIQGANASASCGHIAFAYEQILHDQNINAHLISFYYANGDGINGHTATEVSLNNKDWFIVDPHVGIVWQNKKNEWASPFQLGCQALCYQKNFSEWEYYPSISGKEKYNPKVMPDVLYYMYPDPKLNPAHAISAIGIFKPNDFKNQIKLQELLVFTNATFNEKKQQKFIEYLGAGHGLIMETKLTYYSEKDCNCNR